MLWPCLRRGGYYFIEDIATGSGGEEAYRTSSQGKLLIIKSGTSPLVHRPAFWTPKVRQILQLNDVFFADTLVGHPRIEQTWGDSRERLEAAARLGKMTRVYGLPDERLNHNSHILAIRKR